MKKTNFLQLLLIFLTLTSNAQSLRRSQVYESIEEKDEKIRTQSNSRYAGNCLTTVVDSALHAKFPDMENQQQFENRLQMAMDEAKKHPQPLAAIYKIPVIVHVITNGEAIGTGTNISAAQIQSQITVLNEDFRRKSGTPGFNSSPVGADVEIEFVLALRDPNGNTLPEPGIHRVNGGRSSWDNYDDIEDIVKVRTQWDPYRYFNIWTLKFGGSISSNYGYAQVPTLSGLQGMPTDGGPVKTDGVVISYNTFGRTGNVISPFHKGRIATHEIGHWLGLRHIWGDLTNCSGTDYCNDTPIHSGPNYGCPSGKNSCSGLPVDMIENYMDYTDDLCKNIFTLDQKNRMRTVMENSPLRKELLKSNVSLVTTKPIAFFNTNVSEGCIGDIVNFSDVSLNTPTSWKWILMDVLGNKLLENTNKNISIQFPVEGQFSMRLVVTNANGTDTLTKLNYITIVSNKALTLPFSDDFETTTPLANWVRYNPDADRGFAVITGMSSFGVGNKCIFMDNYNRATNPEGTLDGIISPQLNFNTYKNTYLAFDLAYAPYDQYHSDTLALFYSLDCGKNYIRFWKKGGTDLATAPAALNAFTPTASQWRKEEISLAFLDGQPSVHIAMINISSWGNYLFLDKIKFFNPALTKASNSLFSTNNTGICPGFTVNFTDNSENYPSTWFWEFTGGTPSTSSAQNPFVKYKTAGTYTVKLTTSNSIGGNQLTKTGYITVFPNPVLTITKTTTTGDSTILTANGGSNYTWLDSRGPIASNTNKVTVKPSSTTTYTLVGSSTKGCVDSVFTTVTAGVVSVTSDLHEENFELFPNPTTGKIFVKTPVAEGTLELIDITGKIVSDNHISSASSELDYSKFNKGLYLLRLKNKKGIYHKKIVLE